MLDMITLTRLFLVLQARLPVNRYKMGDVYLWPFMRFTLMNMLDREREVLDGNEQFFRTRARIDSAYEMALSQCGCRRDDQAGEHFMPRNIDAGADNGGGVLSLVRPEEFSLSPQGDHICRLFDPWLDSFSRHVPVSQIELSTQASAIKQPRRNPVFYLPTLSQKHVGTCRDEFHAMERGDIFGLAAEVGKFCQDNFGMELPELGERLRNRVFASFAHKRYFDGIIRLTKPAVGMLQCYYYPVGEGFVWSCRDNGVLSVELQHGLNGFYHYGYSHWTSVPADGYACLPDLFMVWGQESANAIHRWLPPDAGRHRAMIGGVGISAAAGPTGWQEANRRLAERKSGYDKAILLTLSTGIKADAGLSPFLVDIIRAAPPSWLWLIRCHPVATNEFAATKDFPRYRHVVPEGVAEICREAGIVNYESQDATALPMLEAMRHADHHVTSYSSSFLEACAAGVPTTMFHEDAPTLFQADCEGGRAHFVTTRHGIIDSIDKGWSGLDQDAARRSMATDPGLINACVRDILASARRPASGIASPRT